MAVPIDKQLELEATMKTERLDKLVAEKVKQLMEDPHFLRTIYKWHLAQQLIEEMASHSDFENEVKNVIDRYPKTPLPE